MFAVKLEGFKTKKQAEQFLSWYGRQGEQIFGEELNCLNMNYEDGCYINCHKPLVCIDNTLIMQVG